MGDTTRLERARVFDHQKFLDEALNFKNRLQNIDLARLEDQRQAALETALKDVQRRVRTGTLQG